MNNYQGQGNVKDIADKVQGKAVKQAGSFVLIGSISAIFGIMMGVLGTAVVLIQTNTNFARVGNVAKAEAGIVTKEVLLEHLRSGRYKDATMQLETSLDKDLAGATELARDGFDFSRNTLKAIDTERKARGMSGYEPSNATVSAAVQEMFRLVPLPEFAMRDTPIILVDDTP
jgi:hypothetical protein